MKTAKVAALYKELSEQDALLRKEMSKNIESTSGFTHM